MQNSPPPRPPTPSTQTQQEHNLLMDEFSITSSFRAVEAPVSLFYRSSLFL